MLSQVRFILHVGPTDNSFFPHLFLLSTSLTFQDLLDSDWASVRKVLEQADILVIKYAVTDKLAFQQVRNGYAPRLRPLLRHWGVPVILVAVGARLNGEHVRFCSVLFDWVGRHCFRAEDQIRESLSISAWYFCTVTCIKFLSWHFFMIQPQISVY